MMLTGFLIVTCLLAALLLSSRSKLTPASDQIATVRQFTFDSGLTTDPAYWPAGNMIAYASDRATGTNLDIWVQQIGGETRRLTSHEADDHEPDFSPDGTRIAFRSERDGGGIYVVSTLGGPERRLTSVGHSPRFSPDGRWLSYWVGDRSRQFGLGQTFVIPASGGEAHQIAPKFWGAMHAAWSPDSKTLIFFGRKGMGKPDFYAQALDGGDPVATGLADATEAQYRGNYPAAWAGNQFLFSAASGDAINLYSVEIDPATFHARGPRRRLTAGTGIDTRPLLDGNHLVFSSAVQNDDVWSVPIDPSTFKSTGDAVRMTEDLGSDVGCSISEDGTRMTWFSVRSGEAHLMAKDLTTGQQTDLATVPRSRPLAEDISADGQRVAYCAITSTPPTQKVFVIPFSGGTPQQVCDGCVLRDWSGPAALLVSKDLGPASGSLDLLDLTTRTRRQVFPGVAPARGFPDGRWWASYMPQGGMGPFSLSAPAIFVVPILPQRSSTLADEVPITRNEFGDYLVDVAPDGATLVFLSPRDGFHCIWAQKLDPGTKHPAGAPFPVHHLHSARRSTMYVGGGLRRLTVARNKIVFIMAERTGNLWIADLLKPAR
jgi:Tol biopolymer transport system component